MLAGGAVDDGDLAYGAVEARAAGGWGGAVAGGGGVVARRHRSVQVPERRGIRVCLVRFCPLRCLFLCLLVWPLGLLELLLICYGTLLLSKS